MPTSIINIEPTAPACGSALSVQKHRLFRGLLTTVLSATGSAILLWMSQYPLRWETLSWIGLVPLLWTCQSSTSVWRVVGAAWLAGFLFFLLGFRSVAIRPDRPDWMAAVLVAELLACYWAASITLAWCLNRFARVPWMISLPASWIPAEWLRMHVGIGDSIGFPWLQLGHGIIDFEALSQGCREWGELYLTSLVLMVSGCLVDVALPVRNRGASLVTRVVLALIVVALLSTAQAVGRHRLKQDEPTISLRVAIQGDFLQTDVEGALDADSLPIPQADLYVWPSISSTAPLVCLEPGSKQQQITSEIFNYSIAELEAMSHDVRERLGALAARLKAPLVLGAKRFVATREDCRKFGSCLVVMPNSGVIGWHDDPISLGSIDLPSLVSEAWLNTTPDSSFRKYSRGDQRNAFNLEPAGFDAWLVLIVNEEIGFGNLVRGSAALLEDSPNQAFVVHSGIEVQGVGTSLADYQLDLARLRAIELGMPVIRRVRGGCSAVIDSHGRIQWLSKSKEAVQTTTIAVASVDLHRLRPSLFVRYPHLFPLLHVGILLLLILLLVRGAIVAFRGKSTNAASRSHPRTLPRDPP